MKIIGFIRVDGFEHLIRCITDAPVNHYGQRHVIYADGNRLVDGYMYVGTDSGILPEAKLTDVARGSWGRSEQTEWRMCLGRAASMDSPATTDSHAIDA